MVDPWMKTVKKTMARAVVRNSSLDNNDIMSENTFAKKYLKQHLVPHTVVQNCSKRKADRAPLEEIKSFLCFLLRSSHLRPP